MIQYLFRKLFRPMRFVRACIYFSSGVYTGIYFDQNYKVSKVQNPIDWVGKKMNELSETKKK